MARRAQIEPLGELERMLMEVVWRRAPATAREVCDRLSGARERAYTTVMTTLDRLHRKGLLSREKDGLAWRYAPTLSREDFERALADGLVARLMRGHGETGLAAFVDAAASLDDATLDRLEALIRAAKKERGT